MPHQEVLGRVVNLVVLRITPHGAFLCLDDAAEEDSPAVLLPGGEMPAGTQAGDSLKVFIYLDSEDRPIATTRTPKLTLGQVGFLKVSDMTPVGAFMDWGLQKDLLLPYGEQTRDIHVGERHPVALTVDNTGRLAGTMRVSEMLKDPPPFEVGSWVQGEAWRRDQAIGAFIILEGRYTGLLPLGEAESLSRGQSAQFRVTRVRADRKVDVSMRREAHEQAGDDAARILEYLARTDAEPVSDKSDPELIREIFGFGKKTFKRAVGGLLKRGAVRVDEAGLIVLARKE